MADNKDIRKYINLLKEGKKEGIVLKEHGFPDIDDPDTGNETKVEIEFKDGDQIEVEVYAQGVDQLKRLMDLAGIFHKDKQNGTLAHDNQMVPQVSTDPIMPQPTDTLSPAGDSTLDTEPDVMGTPELPGTDVPVDMDAGDHETSDETPELDFDIDSEPEEGLEETRYDRFDYGHPNPHLGQEKYELEASNYSGLASKRNRYVQAKHGDNAMVDVTKAKKGVSVMDEVDESNSSTKSLKEYMAEIDQEKKNLNEVNPKKVGELVAKLTPQNLSAPKHQAISKVAQDLERKVASGQRKVDDLNPEQVMDLVTGDQKAKAAGFNAPEDRGIKDLVKKFGSEFEENQQSTESGDKLFKFHFIDGKKHQGYGSSVTDAFTKLGFGDGATKALDYWEEIDPKDEDVEEKRQYSFKQSILPFQGLTGTQRIRRNALRALKKRKK